MSLHGAATACSAAEAKHLFQLAKNASRGGSHSWHSYDGRELGAADVKTFDLFVVPESQPMHGESSQSVSASPSSGQRMHAVISGEDLRASLVLSEAWS